MVDDLTLLIKKTIRVKYRSYKKFCEAADIPQTTLSGALKHGVGGTSFDTVIKICSELDIRLMNGIYPVTLTSETADLITKLSRLDEKGIHTAATVIEMEYDRVRREDGESAGLPHTALDLPSEESLKAFAEAINKES